MHNKLIISLFFLFTCIKIQAQLNTVNIVRKDIICYARQHYYRIEKSYNINKPPLYYLIIKEPLYEVSFCFGPSKLSAVKTLENFVTFKEKMKKGDSFECTDYLGNKFSIFYLDTENWKHIVLLNKEYFVQNVNGTKFHPAGELSYALENLIKRFKKSKE